MRVCLFILSLFFCVFSFSQQTVSQQQSGTDVIRQTVIQEHGIQESPDRRAVIVIDRGPETQNLEPNQSSQEELAHEEVAHEEEIEAIEILEPELLSKKADLLFIIDNSRSMNRVLENLEQRFEFFLSSLDEDIDWRIGFIDSDVDEQLLFNLEYRGRILNQKILTQDTNQFNQIFLDTLVRNEERPCDYPPYCGSFREQPLKAFQQFLESNEIQDFSRKDALFVAIIITDNDETPERDHSFVDSNSILNSLESSPLETKKIVTYSLSVLYEQCARQIRSNQIIFFKEGRFAVLADELSYQTGGSTFDLCSDSYEDLAVQINSLFNSVSVE